MAYKNPSVELPDNSAMKKKKADAQSAKVYNQLDSTYFVFIDILGFKETFLKKEKVIREVFEYFNYLMSHMKCIVDKSSNCYAGQTSDSLYFYTTNLNHLINFVNVFLHFNMYAMSKNVFFRGGISKGTLFVSEPYQFYGQCVINSFLLEENIAQNPTIAIDKKTKTDLTGKTELWRFDDDPHRNFLNIFSPVVTQDVKVFLEDPLAECIEVDLKLINQIKKKIVENIESLELNDKNYRKYCYLLEKCTSLIEELKNEK